MNDYNKAFQNIKHSLSVDTPITYPFFFICFSLSSFLRENCILIRNVEPFDAYRIFKYGDGTTPRSTLYLNGFRVTLKKLYHLFDF